MSISLTYRGTVYTLPSPGDSDDWGAAFNLFLTALAASQPTAKLTATGTAARSPFFITPSAAPTGPNVVGDLYMTTAGVLKVCTVAGTPGTFVSVGTQT